MSNPLYQKNNDVPNGNTVPHNKQVEQKTSTNVKLSKFNLDHVVLDTLRYGEYKPFMSLAVVPHDEVSFSSVAEVRSDTLESPMLSGISINQDYIYCPLSALIPRTFDIAMITPSYGDDVPDDVFPSITLTSFDSAISSFLTQWNKVFGVSYTAGTPSDLHRFRMLLLGQMLFSSGSLLNSLGYNIPVYIKNGGSNPTVLGYTIDEYFDAYNSVIASVLKKGSSFLVQDPLSSTNSYKYSYDGFGNTTGSAPSFLFSSAIEFLKSMYHHMQVGDLISVSFSYEDPNSSIASMYNCTLGLDGGSISLVQPDDVVELSYDRLTLSPIFAYKSFIYQLCVNQSVDKIFTFDLWQSNMRNLGDLVLGANGSLLPSSYFIYNGTQVLYDYLSGHFYQSYISNCFSLISSTKTDTLKGTAFDFLFALLSIDNTLLYEDRFAGGRVRALGIEDDASILLGDNATAVDVTRSYTFYRFKNKVSKLKNSISRQLAGFFGVDTPPDYHYTQYLAGTSSAVSGFEVANTADEQGKQVTRLNSKTGSYAFSSDITFHGYILGIASFSMPYCYSRGVSRDIFHSTRWDMFNPDFQGLGDDIIREPELFGYSFGSTVNSVFAYENRDNFYKIPISKARGAFTSQLKSWAFVIDQNNNINPNERYAYYRLCSEFLRCNPLDMDRFYTFFGNSSLANWYHFIVKFNNKLSVKRNMFKSPQINLG